MQLIDKPNAYGFVTRTLHWGMAVLFLAQFMSASARALLPRGNEIRDSLWSYHTDLGVTLFLLVMLRGAWGLANLSNRPGHAEDFIGKAAKVGHVALYALMLVVPATRILASAGSERGLRYFGFQALPPRQVEIAWMQIPAELHGELGWLLAFVALGHILMAICWHRLVKKDNTLARMIGWPKNPST
ncbi:MAG: cytochrome b [Pseudomonadota bacterium]